MSLLTANSLTLPVKVLGLLGVLVYQNCWHKDSQIAIAIEAQFDEPSIGRILFR